MLKIKDNVKLEKLEKYGFKKHKHDDKNVVCSKWIRETCYGDNGDYPTNPNDYYFQFYPLIEIMKNHKGERLLYFTLYYNHYVYKLSEVLYDLIKDGLVEKVEE